MQSPDREPAAPNGPKPDPQRVEELFDRLLEAEESERRRVLEDEAIDPAVRSRVKRLLEAFDDPEPKLEEPLAPAMADLAATAPRSVGPYTIRGLVGVGAMGVVYRAEQESPRREVALKLMRGAVEQEDGAVRFELEAQFLGRLQHPGIAQIFESGTAQLDLGVTAYIAMELVDGKPLGDYAQAAALDLTARVELLAELCDAVHHAHLRGVIHRDLKPSNVLVTEAGRVKVIDFGVARAVDPTGDRRAVFDRTLPGQAIGTLAYMSPEQVQGELDRVDARTDVYSLGVLAFELLSGELPHDLEGTTLAEGARRIVEREALRLGAVAPACRGDLDAIVGLALEKNLERRFQSASALADDLRRFLANEPVESRPASTVYLLSRLAARHRTAVIGAATTLAAVVVGAIVAVSYALENRELAELESAARGEAEEQAERANQEAERANEEARRANENAAESERLTKVAEAQVADLQRVTAFQKEQLKSLDIHALGQAIGRELRSVVQSPPPEAADLGDPEVRLMILDEALEGVNLTAVARRTLQHWMLDGMRQAIETQFADRPAMLAELLAGHAFILLNMGAAREAMEVARTTHRLFESTVGAEDTRTFSATVELIALLYSANEFQAAYDLAHASREAVEALGGPTSPAAFTLLRTLGGAAGNLHLYDEAIATFREEIARLDSFGPAPPAEIDTFRWDARMNLVSTMIAAGSADAEAEVILHARLEDLEDREPGFFRTRKEMSTMIHLGQYHYQLGHVDEAATWFEQSLERARSVHGDRHLALSVFLRDLAKVRRDQGRHEEAVALQQENYELHVQLLGPEHPGTQEFAYHLIVGLIDVERLEDAHRLCERSFDYAQGIYGPSHEKTELFRAAFIRVLQLRQEREGGGAFAEAIRELGGA